MGNDNCMNVSKDEWIHFLAENSDSQKGKPKWFDKFMAFRRAKKYVNSLIDMGTIISLANEKYMVNPLFCCHFQGGKRFNELIAVYLSVCRFKQVMTREEIGIFMEYVKTISDERGAEQ